MQVQA